MSEVTALIVHIIQVKNNFVYLNSKLLDKLQNPTNNLICIEIKVNQECNYGSCSVTPFNFNGENAFNISAAFAQTLNVKEYDTVIISKVDSVISLKTVYVTAMSADDLQILECSTEAIQSTLLNQIRIVRIHQILSVWISKSFTLKIHIDQLNDGVIHGKLEQYTEVIVSLDVKVCTNCSLTDTENKYKPEMSLNSSWNYLKDMFSSLGWNGKNSTVKSADKTNETSFISSGVFRCMPFKNNFKHQLIQYPYNAFISRKYCSYTSSYVREGNYFLCRLTYIPYTSTKTPKKMQSLNEDTASITELFGHEIYIHLYIIEDTDVTDSSFLMMNSYPTIFVSQAVQYFFNLKINSKVKLDLIHNENKQRLTEINYTFIKKASLEEKAIDNVKLHFQTCLQNSPKLIVNNYCLFTLDTFGLNVIYLTFNPANLPFVELSKEDIDRCDFRLVQRKIDVKLEDDMNDPTVKMTECTTPLSFQQVIVRKLKTTLLLKLRLLKSSCTSHLENNNHILIEGEAGTSKSNIIAFVCNEMSKLSFGIFTKILDCKSLKGKLVSKMEKILEAALNECVYYQPAILCFDDLDVLFSSSKQNSQVEPSVSSYSNRLSHMIHDSFRLRSGHHITVLATVSSTSNLEPCLFQARGSSLFSSSFPIPALNQDMRQEAFVRLLSSKVNFNTTSIIQNSEYMSTVVQRLENYCIQDIKDLVDRTCFEAVRGRVDIDRKLDVFEVCEADVDRAIQETVPLSLIDIELRKDTTVSWKDVGGLTDAKQLLTEILIWPSQFPKIFEQCPLKMQSGVLLYGVPGSGKTLLASAVAGESRLNFISIKGPELLSKFVGDSEEGIRNTFRKAQNAKPCILFFDEFDSLAPRRGNDITGVTDRVVNQLLTELDGVESVSGVWVLAATSRPDLIDPALLRPGRLGTMVHCPLPNQAERCSILEVISSSIDLPNDIDFNAVACITEGYTGADLRAVLYTAVVSNDQSRLSVIRSHLESRDELKEFPSSPTVIKNVDTQHLIEAVHKTKPSLKLDERLAYERIYKRFLEREETFETPVENQRLTYA